MEPQAWIDGPGACVAGVWRQSNSATDKILRQPKEPMSNEIVLVAVVLAAVVAIYLLRHVIALAIRLIVLAALVLGLVWAWQHRDELLDAVAPYLGPVGERLGELDLSNVRAKLADLLSDEEPDAPEDAGMSAAAETVERLEALRAPEQREAAEETGTADESNDAEAPDDLQKSAP